MDTPAGKIVGAPQLIDRIVVGGVEGEALGVCRVSGDPHHPTVGKVLWGLLTVKGLRVGESFVGQLLESSPFADLRRDEGSGGPTAAAGRYAAAVDQHHPQTFSVQMPRRAHPGDSGTDDGDIVPIGHGAPLGVCAKT